MRQGALRILGTPLDGTHHWGIDDALNIIRIIKHMLAAPT